jgi:hypothetical protein
LIERWFLGFDAAAWKAFVMSSVLKESLRRSWGWEVGIGIVEVILAGWFDLLFWLEVDSLGDARCG